jgi:acyl carrier protein
MIIAHSKEDIGSQVMERISSYTGAQAISKEDTLEAIGLDSLDVVEVLMNVEEVLGLPYGTLDFEYSSGIMGLGRTEPSPAVENLIKHVTQRAAEVRR